ncbi:PfkB family carbohydrate kinase [Saccharothrix obliqua]|uniref:PfkB family carbohydrate kinase n=1 Tax=Saccharothrix obliqua TaxID=2861747 RepID=UPI0027E36593|nr:PfkB family carbohydrate kinase [Saccharothrix obliqua]
MDVIVMGQVARDLVLVVPEVPDAGSTAPVRTRREVPGGKGTNIAVGLAQLGVRVGLLGVVGDDAVGQGLTERLRHDGVDTGAVVRRSGTATGLIVEVLTGGGRWRYLEDLPPAVQLHEDDVHAAEAALTAADWLVVQLQQPPAAALAAVRLAKGAGRRVVLDGAPADDGRRDELLSRADVLRADHHEAELLTGYRLDDVGTALRAARELLSRGPSVVALAVGGAGNVFAWEGGDLVLPLVDVDVVDSTGGGDAFVAGLTCALSRGDRPERAARLAVAAAGVTATHPGGRPDLAAHRVGRALERLPDTTG